MHDPTKRAARAAIDRAQDRLVEISHRLHAHPELGFEDNALALGRVFPQDDRMAASTDMANVSLVVPAIQPLVSIDSGAAGQHQAEFAEFPARPAADRALLDGGIAMAWTGIDLARSMGSPLGHGRENPT